MAEQINKDMTFGELLEKFPEKAAVLGEFGLHCIGCHIAVIETIEQGARAHGLSDDQIDEMVQKLNA